MHIKSYIFHICIYLITKYSVMMIHVVTRLYERAVTVGSTFTNFVKYCHNGVFYSCTGYKEILVLWPFEINLCMISIKWFLNLTYVLYECYNIMLCIKDRKHINCLFAIRRIISKVKDVNKTKTCFPTPPLVLVCLHVACPSPLWTSASSIRHWFLVWQCNS